MLSTQELADRIRSLYDEFPYPTTDEQAVLNAPLQLPSSEWCNALVRIERKVLAPGNRVLIAGCGTGAEAFALNRAMPGMQIVAVDFSEKSIAVARAAAEKAKVANIEFRHADLTDSGLPEALGRFDFVYCHHVLEFIPDHAAAMRNLARFVEPDGGVYLQVVTEFHPNVSFRAAMPFFHLDPNRLEDTAETRERLRLMEALRDPIAVKMSPPFHQRPAGLLATELFGPSVHYFPFQTWLRLAREQGLHLCGTTNSCGDLAHFPTPDEREPLAAMSRAQVAEINHQMAHNMLEKIVFSPRPPAAAPWSDGDALPNWRPVAQFWDRTLLPRKPRGQTWHDGGEVDLKIGSATSIRGSLAWWFIEFLRRCDGERSLVEILAGLELEFKTGSLTLPVGIVNNLYHGLVLNFLPPRVEIQNQGTS